jgi:hypothetical protein
MIAGLADERQTVEAEDFQTAHRWLLEAEQFMPEVFKDMVSHEDGQIHEEMRNYLFNLYMKTNRTPIHASVIFQFLSKRVSSYQIQRIIDVSISADFIRRVAGTEGDDAEYVPQSPGNAPNPGVM